MRRLIRLAIVVTLLWWGFHAGGWWGFMFVLMVAGAVGIVRPYRPAQYELSEAQERYEERIDHSRRGSYADPTRPQPGDDHPLLLTHEIKARRR